MKRYFALFLGNFAFSAAGSRSVRYVSMIFWQFVSSCLPNAYAVCVLSSSSSFSSGVKFAVTGIVCDFPCVAPYFSAAVSSRVLVFGAVGCAELEGEFAGAGAVCPAGVLAACGRAIAGAQHTTHNTPHANVNLETLRKIGINCTPS